MRTREVGLGVAAGIVLLLIGVANPGGFGASIGQHLLGGAAQFWYVGVGMILLAFVLKARGASPDAVGLVGLVGVAWITFVGGAIAWLVVMLATQPFGP